MPHTFSLTDFSFKLFSEATEFLPNSPHLFINFKYAVLLSSNKKNKTFASKNLPVKLEVCTLQSIPSCLERWTQAPPVSSSFSELPKWCEPVHVYTMPKAGLFCTEKIPKRHGSAKYTDEVFKSLSNLVCTWEVYFYLSSLYWLLHMRWWEGKNSKSNAIIRHTVCIPSLIRF